eukprot:scaffold30614_cov146-Isochrysis_galbana.AAC.1
MWGQLGPTIQLILPHARHLLRPAARLVWSSFGQVAEHVYTDSSSPSHLSTLFSCWCLLAHRSSAPARERPRRPLPPCRPVGERKGILQQLISLTILVLPVTVGRA